MFNRHQLAFLKPWIIPLGIFALALVVRVPGLDTFVTADEDLWISRSQQFTSGLLFSDYQCLPPESGRKSPTTGLGCTFQTTYPAVTTMWGGGLGLLAYYWQAVRPTGVGLRTFLNSPDLLDPAVLAAMRLPLAVAAALFVLLFYLLARRLLGEKVAFVAALLVALSPFHIALSRVLHHDALAAHFIVLALLPMAGYWLQGWKRRWLLVSAILAGLAFLTKQVSWFMMPCAAMIGLLGLYERRRRGEWRGWASVGQVAGEGLLWGSVAWLTFVALFPAMWITPGEIIQRMIEGTLAATGQGHERDQYFLGTISRNPGLLLYPVGWLLEASPLEVLGLLALPAAAWTSFRSPRSLRSLRQTLAEHPTYVALALFIATFLAFETLAGRKMVRYLLPVFPAIDIFVAIGLLWLAERLARLARRETIQRWALPALGGLVLVSQGWLAWDNYPYYFTYYNPLLGGAAGAAKMIDVGWGEGLNEAAAYLNRQPDSASLEVTSDYYTTLNAFFAGQAISFTDEIGDAMKGDYLVFYRRYLQSNLHDPNLWHYFDRHATPAYRVTLQGLDYALVYRNPIEQHACTQDDRKGQKLEPFGYNLAPDGSLTLFWQNRQGGDRPPALQAGLTPASGGDTHSQRDPERWVACAPAPAFADEASHKGAIVESQCSLGLPAAAGVPPGYYDLSLGLGDDKVTPLAFPVGEMAVLVDGDGRFSPVAPADALAQSVQGGLVKPVNVAFGNTLSLAGYRLEPADWRAGGEGTLDLYWRPQRKLDLALLVTQFRLPLRVLPPGATEPVLTVSHPFFPRCLAARNLTPGGVLQARFRLTLPKSLPPGAYTLQVCLSTGKQSSDCLPLPVNVVH